MTFNIEKFNKKNLPNQIDVKVNIQSRSACFNYNFIAFFFVPWLLVKAWILPIPNSIQQQADEAISHGFDGVIIYVDKAIQSTQYAASGWHNRETKKTVYEDALFKIAGISKILERQKTSRQVYIHKRLLLFFLIDPV